MKKYSIILPTYNNEKYIKECINSFLSQSFDDFELIVSNNLSTDETQNILTSFSDKRLKVIHPDRHLDHMDHWNFAVSHANGEWIYTLGADDAVLPFFFEQLEYLTKIATSKKINLLRCERAYYFHKGMEDIYGDSHVSFYAVPKYEIRTTKKVLSDAMKRESCFYEIPQMYTTSLFKSSVLGKITKFSKELRIFPKNTWGQDAVMGLYACIFEKYYINTKIPFAWVGSSPSSAGLKDGRSKISDITDFSTDNPYRTVNSTIQLLYYDLKKLFSSLPKNIIPFYIKKILRNPSTVYSYVYKERFLKSKSLETSDRLPALKAYLTYNNLKFADIEKKAQKLLAKELVIEKFKKSYVYTRFHDNRILRYLNRNKKKQDCFSIELKQNNYMTYTELNSLLLKDDGLLNILKSK